MLRFISEPNYESDVTGVNHNNIYWNGKFCIDTQLRVSTLSWDQLKWFQCGNATILQSCNPTMLQFLNFKMVKSLNYAMKLGMAYKISFWLKALDVLFN